MTVPKWYVDDEKPWFKHYQEGVPKHPEFPVISLGDWFDQKTEEFAKNKAIYFSKTFMNYRVLRKYTDSFATSLSRLGVKKGDVVAILLPNCFQFTICGRVGFGNFGGLGLSASISNGDFCEGTIETEGEFIEGGDIFGGSGSISRSTDGNGSVSGGYGGVAYGGAAGKEFCEVVTKCIN